MADDLFIGKLLYLSSSYWQLILSLILLPNNGLLGTFIFLVVVLQDSKGKKSRNGILYTTIYYLQPLPGTLFIMEASGRLGHKTLRTEH
jgi:hypothetical protein